MIIVLIVEPYAAHAHQVFNFAYLEKEAREWPNQQRSHGQFTM